MSPFKAHKSPNIGPPPPIRSKGPISLAAKRKVTEPHLK